MIWDIALLAQAELNPEQILKVAQLVDVTKLSLAAAILGVGVVLNRALQSTLERMGEDQAKRRLFFKKVQSFSRVGILAVCAYLLVMVFFGGDEDRTALLGVGGTLMFALGFALKDTAGSLMAGIMILIDQPFQVGDRIQFGSTYGEVKDIGLRSVRIVTLDDNEVSIPNNKFLTEAVASANAGALDMMVVVEFHIAMSEDFDLAKRLVYEACITSKFVYLDKPVQILLKEQVTNIAYSTIIICKAYVIDARYETEFISDVTERVKRAFQSHRVRYPYAREYQLTAMNWEEDV